MKNKSKAIGTRVECRAFTMAEVVIAMTIIGVIAAITIPSLMGKTSERQFVATYKKDFAVIEQTLKMASADGKDASTDAPGTYTYTNSANEPVSVANLALGQALIEYAGAIELPTAWTVKLSANSSWSINQTSVTVVPGTSTPVNNMTIPTGAHRHVYLLKDKLANLVVFAPASGRCSSAGKPIVGSDNSVSYAGSYCYGYIDVNGSKGPNQVIACDNQTSVMVSGNEGSVLNLDEITANGCELSSDSITDVYPVIIYDDKIIPATPAAVAVLQSSD